MKGEWREVKRTGREDENVFGISKKERTYRDTTSCLVVCDIKVFNFDTDTEYLSRDEIQQLE
jgi:hypothetical protein